MTSISSNIYMIAEMHFKKLIGIKAVTWWARISPPSPETIKASQWIRCWKAITETSDRFCPNVSSFTSRLTMLIFPKMRCRIRNEKFLRFAGSRRDFHTSIAVSLALSAVQVFFYRFFRVMIFWMLEVIKICLQNMKISTKNIPIFNGKNPN